MLTVVEKKTIKTILKNNHRARDSEYSKQVLFSHIFWYQISRI